MLDSENRPWGFWEEYLNEETYRVKRIQIKPGKRISLQKHINRSEYWVIVSGEGKLYLNEQVEKLSVGKTVFIQKNDIHRAECTGNVPLIIIEVQMGRCDENDIIRLEDDWKRT